VKKLARLVLFYSISFIVVFSLFAVFRILSLWTGAARSLSGEAAELGSIVPVLKTALPAALYIDMLMSLSYTVRKKIAAPLAMLALMVLSGAFTLGISMGIQRVDGLDLRLPAPPKTAGREGLILSSHGTTMVLLGQGAASPRVLVYPRRLLVYQAAQEDGPLPALPFQDRRSPLMDSIVADLGRSGRQFSERFAGGLREGGAYAGALIFLLASLRFILDLSGWPLVNLFLGALAFRGVLALEGFVTSDAVSSVLFSVIGNRLPAEFIVPAVFAALGLLVIVYAMLTALARGGAPEHG